MFGSRGETSLRDWYAENFAPKDANASVADVGAALVKMLRSACEPFEFVEGVVRDSEDCVTVSIREGTNLKDGKRERFFNAVGGACAQCGLSTDVSITYVNAETEFLYVAD